MKALRLIGCRSGAINFPKQRVGRVSLPSPELPGISRCMHVCMSHDHQHDAASARQPESTHAWIGQHSGPRAVICHRIGSFQSCIVIVVPCRDQAGDGTRPGT